MEKLEAPYKIIAAILPNGAKIRFDQSGLKLINLREISDCKIGDLIIPNEGWNVTRRDILNGYQYKIKSLNSNFELQVVTIQEDGDEPYYATGAIFIMCNRKILVEQWQKEIIKYK